MRVRTWWKSLAVLNCLLPAVWAIKPGDPMPDLVAEDRSGAQVQLSEYRQKKAVVLLAHGGGEELTAEIRDEACRLLEPLGTVALFAGSEALAARKLLAGTEPATILIDPSGVVRRLSGGRALTGSDLAAFVKVWQYGKVVFEASCARCHGEDGALQSCEDVKQLAGIGNRLTADEIRERLRMGEVNHREVFIRGQFFKREEVDAVIIYISGL